MSVITNDIYLKLRLVVKFKKGEPVEQDLGTNRIFLTQLCPFFIRRIVTNKYSGMLPHTWNSTSTFSSTIFIVLTTTGAIVPGSLFLDILTN